VAGGVAWATGGTGGGATCGGALFPVAFGEGVAGGPPRSTADFGEGDTPTSADAAGGKAETAGAGGADGPAEEAFVVVVIGAEGAIAPTEGACDPGVVPASFPRRRKSDPSPTMLTRLAPTTMATARLVPPPGRAPP
jgi:hypothetical protein